jgi:hypothetical protein
MKTRTRVETSIAAAIVLLCLAASTSGASGTPWPALLGPREAFPPEVSTAVERVWIEPTLRRTISGPSARVSLDVYEAFVDTPEVTAAAARFRRIRSYEIHAVDDDRYWGDDGDGARFVARVLRREPRRRVILSEGQHVSPLLGTIRGSALTVFDLEPQDGELTPRLTAYMYIANGGALTLARLVVPTFGFIADHKLGEGLRVTSMVAEWAVDRSGGFCDWLAHEPIPPVQRDRVLAALPTCAAVSRSSTPRPS